MITRNEIEVARAMRGRSRKTIIDIYIAFAVDRAPVEDGADIGWVVSELHEMNVRELQKPIRWATVMLLENQYELTKRLFMLRLQRIADKSAWGEYPGEIWRGIVSFARLGIIYVRRGLSPLHAPVLSPAEWERLRALQCQP